MSREEIFDSFYLATRRAVLLQSFALTGDLQAARTAVRDAYVAAWHHWRKVGRLEDPVGWVRPHAWALAQRRHVGRIWHRNRGLDAEQVSLLEALSRLSGTQRRVLVLVHLGDQPLPGVGRELGLAPTAVEEHLQAATARLGVALDTDSAALRARLLTLDTALEHTSLPRASIIRRAGRKRRQLHTLVGAALATVVAVAAGAVAHEPGRARAVNVPALVPSQVPSAPAPEEERRSPTAEDLLDADQIRRLGRGARWEVLDTHDNTRGDGLNTICQQARFADPDGLAALVREFEASGKVERSAVQTVEVSRTVKQASAGYATTLGWYAGCRVARLQILAAYRVADVGARAEVLLLRGWDRPVTTYTVGIARVGKVTTTTVGATVGAAPPPTAEIAQSLADSVAMLCTESGARTCPHSPGVRRVPPPPSGEEAGILAIADLPPVGDLRKPWVGTDAEPARPNPAATTCDRANFVRAGAVRTRTRTYLIPQARLPARFGLSESYGRFPSARAARRFVEEVRGRVAGCEDRDLATSVTDARRGRSGDLDVEWWSWDLRTEISDREAIRFRVGFVLMRDAVAQVTFAPAPRQDMTARQFDALLVRAGARLGELD